VRCAAVEKLHVTDGVPPLWAFPEILDAQTPVQK
jgi:hypothetical protein